MLNAPSITRTLQQQLRDHCLERDGYCCIVTEIQTALQWCLKASPSSITICGEMRNTGLVACTLKKDTVHGYLGLGSSYISSSIYLASL